jgi:hypothetical protein
METVKALLATPVDTLDRVIAYEQGELRMPEIIALFQDLVDTGLAWKLQGHYGRVATAMIAAGYVKPVVQ